MRSGVAPPSATRRPSALEGGTERHSRVHESGASARHAGDFRTDQFSFGALIYEMATGQLRLPPRQRRRHASAVLHEEPRPIAESCNSRIPAALRWIVEQCLAKDVTERYSATDDLARELRRVRDRLLEALSEAKPAESPVVGRVSAMEDACAWDVGAVALGAIAAASCCAPPSTRRRALFRSPRRRVRGRSGVVGGWTDPCLRRRRRRRAPDLRQAAGRRARASGHARPVRRAVPVLGARRPGACYFISGAGEWDALWSVSVTGGRPELLLENVTRAAIDREGKRFALLRPDSSPQWSTPVVVFTAPS